MAKVQTEFPEDVMKYLRIEKVMRDKNNIPDTVVSCIEELMRIKGIEKG